MRFRTPPSLAGFELVKCLPAFQPARNMFLIRRLGGKTFSKIAGS